MAKYGDIRAKSEMDAISDRLAHLTHWLEDLNAMPTFNTGATFKINASSRGIYWEEDDEGAFDPESIDWEQLIELYRDDPALVFIFGQLERYFDSQVPGFRPGPRLKWSDGSGAVPLSPNAVGSGTSTPGLHLYSDTTSTVSLSHPVTVHYDTNGAMTVRYDEE